MDINKKTLLSCPSDHATYELVDIVNVDHPLFPGWKKRVVISVTGESCFVLDDNNQMFVDLSLFLYSIQSGTFKILTKID